MAEWTIYGKRTSGGVESTVEIAVAKDVELHDVWMGECFVTFSVKSADPVDWHFDDYLTYRGEVYSLSYDPNVVKKARRGTYGEGFTYDNVRFYSLGYKTKNYGFKDVVINDNNLTYTSLATFPFFCASIEDFADRMQANLNRENQSSLVSGWKVLTPSYSRTTQRGVTITQAQWSQYYTGSEPTGETDVNIDIDRQNCFDVMKMAYEKFGLAYYIVGTTIVIGGKPVQLNTGSANIFRYGKGLGLYEIERTSDDSQELVTKLFAYGSEQNLPLNYYANLHKKAYTQGLKDHYNDEYNIRCYTYLYATVRNAFTHPARTVIVSDGNGHSCPCTANSVNYDGTERLNLYFPDGMTFDINGEEVTCDAESFWEEIDDHQHLYFDYGVDMNRWPPDSIKSEHEYPATLSINRLMLPGFPDTSLHDWVAANHSELLSKYDFSHDAMDPWIKSKNMPSMGLFEGTVNFDGSQQKEIFPTIENTSAGVVTMPSVITDNGYVTDPEFFDIEVADDAINWTEALSNSTEDVMISMKSGYCAGRDFKVQKAKKNITDDGWVLTLERHHDNSMGRYFPYKDNDVSGYCQIRARDVRAGGYAGDTFTVTGIQIPDTYIEAAAEKLLIAACGHLDKRDHVRYTYLPKIDETFMQKDYDERETESYHDIIRAGMKLEFEDSDLGIWHSPFIDNLTIRENGNNGIPTYDVVLRDEKEKGTLEKLTDSITELMANPPVQVVERQQRTLQYIEYPEWDEDGMYYFETVNPDTDELETSRVWHRGCLWECHRTLTRQEPWFTNRDWVCLRASEIALNFFDDNEDYPMPLTVVQVRHGHVDFTVVPYLIIGNEDITEGNVTEWNWTRESESAGSDEQWNALPKTSARTLNVTNEDMPTGWARGQKLVFTCTASLAFEIDENVNTIMNKVIF